MNESERERERERLIFTWSCDYIWAWWWWALWETNLSWERILLQSPTVWRASRHMSPDFSFTNTSPELGGINPFHMPILVPTHYKHPQLGPFFPSISKPARKIRIWDQVIIMPKFHPLTTLLHKTCKSLFFFFCAQTKLGSQQKVGYVPLE